MIEVKSAEEEPLTAGRTYVPPVECVRAGCSGEHRGECSRCDNRMLKWLVFDKEVQNERD